MVSTALSPLNAKAISTFDDETNRAIAAMLRTNMGG
jgi:hypothetical protein